MCQGIFDIWHLSNFVTIPKVLFNYGKVLQAWKSKV